MLTSQGIAGISEQEIGPDFNPSTISRTVFSPDGTMMAQYDRVGQIRVFEFDRGTGQFSNLTELEADTTAEGFDGSIAFSPSGQFLYVSSLLRIYQFDLEAPDVQASRVLLDVYDGYKYLNIFSANFGFMQLAPNCRIYMSTRNATPFYHVINYPDRKGHECGFEQRGQPLIATNIGSIPNNPNYNLGTGFPVCDSSIQLVVSSVDVLPPPVEVQVYPNPASGSITVALPVPLPAPATWSLYSAVGQRVLSHKMERGTSEVNISLSGVPPGLYFWELRPGGGGLPRSGKVVVLE